MQIPVFLAAVCEHMVQKTVLMRWDNTYDFFLITYDFFFWSVSLSWFSLAAVNPWDRYEVKTALFDKLLL